MSIVPANIRLDLMDEVDSVRVVWDRVKLGWEGRYAEANGYTLRYDNLPSSAGAYDPTIMDVGVSKRFLLTADVDSGVVDGKVLFVGVASNYVLNPGLELGSGNTFTNWTSSVVGSGTVTEETTVINEGTRSAKLLCTGGGDSAVFLSDVFWVDPDETYYVTLVVKGSGTTLFRVKVEEFREDGSTSTQDQTLLAPASIGTTTTRLAYTCAALHANTEKMRISVDQGAVNGSVYVDSIRCRTVLRKDSFATKSRYQNRASPRYANISKSTTPKSSEL